MKTQQLCVLAEENGCKVYRDRMLKDLSERLGINIKRGIINYNCGSLHVYERHFKFLENN